MAGATTPNIEGLDHEVSAKALANVAALIPDLQKCFLLATELGFSKVELLGVTSFDRMTAQNILNKWVAKKGKRATSLALYEALVGAELTIVAEATLELLKVRSTD